MSPELQLAAAFVLDLLLGDPRWLPHPVRLIGRLAAGLENPLRRAFPSARVAGVAIVAGVLLTAGGMTALIIWLGYLCHPWLGDGLGVLALYTTLATRDLGAHAGAVWRALMRGDLSGARRKAGRMVGRDTDCLDETGVARAAIESVAENASDGVVGPLFYAALGGPAAAMMYKAASTLDSMFGYKNERYRDFGRASARLDDLLNLIPARVTGLLMVAAAWLLGLNGRGAWRILLRDGRKHPSPNSGLGEAAMAGALGIQLGGVNSYGGETSIKPFLGDPLTPISRSHIRQAVVVMVFVAVLALGLFLGLRTLLR
ncbi:MAG: adenosylcobinamide-phosphate synthase CbiB [Verrucomicrobiae bacterium]|nr:adenosylcobinamide-phosphate synthase CbiB [Verrucomicrobiae bacterium]